MRQVFFWLGLLLLQFLILAEPRFPLAGEIGQSERLSIGRLNQAGFRQSSHCTAVLVGPKLAMTAAHCMRGEAFGELHLLLGYDRGAWTEHLFVEDWSFEPQGRDLMLLKLEGTAEAAPLPLAEDPPRSGETVIMAGYGRPAIHLLSQDTCKVGQVGPTRFHLACPAARGSSGGPVLRVTEEGGFEILGILSASSAALSIVERVEEVW